jgi:hypothetical protein
MKNSHEPPLVANLLTMTTRSFVNITLIRPLCSASSNYRIYSIFFQNRFLYSRRWVKIRLCATVASNGNIIHTQDEFVCNTDNVIPGRHEKKTPSRRKPVTWQCFCNKNRMQSSVTASGPPWWEADKQPPEQRCGLFCTYKTRKGYNFIRDTWWGTCVHRKLPG